MQPALFHLRERVLLLLLFLGISVFHFVSAYAPGPAPNWHGQTSEYYPLLTDAFLAGQISLLVKPDPRMLALPNPYDPEANAFYRLHDASLYHGKYYLYFGPTPAITLFLPYKLLTGAYLPTRAAVALFCIGGYGCSCALLFLLVWREKWVCPFWLGALAVASLGTASLVMFLLMRPSFYETAIAAGYCFAMAGFLAMAYALGSERPSRGVLAAAGLAFGLAAGCRPNLALVAIGVTALMVFRMRREIRRALVFVSPVVLCGALLAAYNYVRFQNPLEFGVRYELLASLSDFGYHFDHIAANILPGLYGLILSPPHTYGSDPAMGLLRGAPVALFGLAMPILLRTSFARETLHSSASRLTVYAVYVSGAGLLAMMILLNFNLGRYAVDFAPEFVLVSWCLLMALWQRIRTLNRLKVALFQLAMVGISLYSAGLDFRSDLPARHSSSELQRRTVASTPGDRLVR